MVLFNDNYNYSDTQLDYTGPATVLAIHSVDRKVRVSPVNMDEFSTIWAVLALPYDVNISIGDTVLVTGDHPENLYVTGIIKQKNPAQTEDIFLSSGLSATRKKTHDKESLEIKDEQGTLLISFDGESRECRVYGGVGDLKFISPEGNISFAAGKSIQFESEQQLNFQAGDGVHLAASRGSSQSQIGLNPHSVDIKGQQFSLHSQRGKFVIQDTTFLGEKFRATLKHVKLFMHILDSTANTIREKAKNVYKTVEGLFQTRSGRSRTLVESSSHFKAKRIYEIADEDVKIDGKKIHLG